MMSLDETLYEIVRRAVRDGMREDLATMATRMQPLGPSRDEPGYLTTAQAAELANVSPRTIREWKRSGRLRVAGRGKSDLYELQEVRRAVAAARDPDPGSVIDISAAATRIASELSTPRSTKRDPGDRRRP